MERILFKAQWGKKKSNVRISCVINDSLGFFDNAYCEVLHVHWIWIFWKTKMSWILHRYVLWFPNSEFLNKLGNYLAFLSQIEKDKPAKEHSLLIFRENSKFGIGDIIWWTDVMVSTLIQWIDNYKCALITKF